MLLSSRQSTHTARPSAPAAFLGGARRPVLRRAPSIRLAQVPRAYGGYWGNCGPSGMMGSVNMGNLMNRPLAEVLQQLQRDVNAAQQQARQHQQNNGESGSNARRNSMRLPVDTIDTEEAVWYFVDLPGLEKSDLQIKANQQDRTITISGERFPPTVGEEDAKQARNLQRLFGKFSHTITLPKDADSQLISAKVDKGVLRIKVLKATVPEPEMQNVPID